jgi:ubiquinone/menaquinone biosynthesis C-methylase UbiE
MKRRGKTAIVVLIVLGATWATAQVADQHHPPESTSAYIRALEDPSRDEWQKPEEVVEKLAVKPGEMVADIGAGSGYFSVRLARAVGPTGKVYAVDIEPGLLSYLEQRTKRDSIPNIQIVLADAHDPKLQPESVDLIFICDVLHHISDRDKYYPLLARALKPGGRLVNIDFQKRPLPVGPPVEMKIANQAMIDEVRPAGFRLVEEFDFLKYQYFLVFKH